ncbi:hypothetical protein ACOZB2_27700, partial [Pantoea endophytica]
ILNALSPLWTFLYGSSRLKWNGLSQCLANPFSQTVAMSLLQMSRKVRQNPCDILKIWQVQNALRLALQP